MDGKMTSQDGDKGESDATAKKRQMGRLVQEENREAGDVKMGVYVPFLKQTSLFQSVYTYGPNIRDVFNVQVLVLLPGVWTGEDSCGDSAVFSVPRADGAGPLLSRAVGRRRQWGWIHTPSVFSLYTNQKFRIRRK